MGGSRESVCTHNPPAESHSSPRGEEERGSLSCFPTLPCQLLLAGSHPAPGGPRCLPGRLRGPTGTISAALGQRAPAPEPPHPCIPASPHPCIPASPHPCIPAHHSPSSPTLGVGRGPRFPTGHQGYKILPFRQNAVSRCLLGPSLRAPPQVLPMRPGEPAEAALLFQPR